jgi:hypothetical protein
MYTHTHVLIHHTHKCTYTLPFTRTRTHVLTNKKTSIHTQTYLKHTHTLTHCHTKYTLLHPHVKSTHTHIHTQTHTCLRTHTYTHTNTSAQTYAHTYTRTPIGINQHRQNSHTHAADPHPPRRHTRRHTHRQTETAVKFSSSSEDDISFYLKVFMRVKQFVTLTPKWKNVHLPPFRRFVHKNRDFNSNAFFCCVFVLKSSVSVCFF